MSLDVGYSQRPDEPGPDDVVEDPQAVLETGRRRLRIVAGILAAEALALLLFAGYLVVNLIGGSDQTTSTSNTVIEIVAYVIVVAVLLLLARGFLRAQRWARAPAIVIQLIVLLGIGWPLLQGSMWYRLPLGLPVSLGSLVAIVLTLTPSALAAVEAESMDPRAD